MTSSKSLWLGLLFGLLLSGCSGLKTQSIANSAQLLAPTSPNPSSSPSPEFWQIRSRLSVHHGEQAWSGSLRWRHLSTGDEITIRDPIGRTRLRASSLPATNSRDSHTGATLQLAGQPIRHGDSIEGLLASVSDLHIPFGRFTTWLTADPGALDGAIIDPETGLLNQVTDQGWTVVYQKYRTVGTLQLPRKIMISNQETEIRMVVSRWLLDNS